MALPRSASDGGVEWSIRARRALRYCRARRPEFEIRYAGVFGKKSVSGMNRVGVGDFGGADDGRNIKITARAFRGTDADCFIRETCMQAVPVRFGINRDGFDPEVLAGADHAKRDFAAIGD